MKKIIVIGDGIIANTLLYYLSQKFKDHSFLQIYASDFYPPVSETSTATVALRNTKKGLSELGDLLVDGFETFKNFYDEKKPRGIIQVPHYQKTLSSDEKFIKRYGGKEFFEESYLVNWLEYKAWLRSHFQDQVITKRELFNKENYQFEKLFWCTNFSKGESPFKPRAGSYLEVEFKNEPCLHEIDGLNIIFTGDKLIIGSTTLRESFHTPPLNELRVLWEKASHYLDQKIPPFETFDIKTGVRSLGKRMPFIKEIEQNEWGLFDFHKNGFLLSHFAIQKVIQAI